MQLSLPERLVTDESLYLSRRGFMRAVAATAAVAAAPPLIAAPNPRYTLDRPLSDEKVVARNNIFDEFTLNRQKVWEVAKDFVTSPWAIHIGGAVQKEKKVDVTELVRRFGVEERVYRHRCVEAWAMAVPWTGFPFRKLVEFAAPLASARYVRMMSFTCPEKAPGWYASKRVFPYYESLTLAEATNELAFLATGIYGHALPPQHGAPIRLAVPWKYGFKSIKSIVSFLFTVEKPGTFWNDLSPAKYSFAANVDPSETIPWSQAQESLIGTNETRKTQLYNGYGSFVADLYR